ncbi:MAG: hypothetical protein DRP35_03560 [Candidatus Zixiibacteriota bacterium]|nr:MAG: hypothetical protein DRP35_03560 [candidate division Zixibacteria bacterium]
MYNTQRERQMKFWTGFFQVGTLIIIFLTLIYIHLFLGQFLSPTIKVILTFWGVVYLFVFISELKAIKRVAIRAFALLNCFK